MAKKTDLKEDDYQCLEQIEALIDEELIISSNGDKNNKSVSNDEQKDAIKKLITKRQSTAHYGQKQEKEDYLQALEHEFIKQRHSNARSALCLSGGGIRSATFSLGVLQGIAKKRKLSEFDYLSTVSGGGYIGSWLSRWMHEKKRL